MRRPLLFASSVAVWVLGCAPTSPTGGDDGGDTRDASVRDASAVRDAAAEDAPGDHAGPDDAGQEDTLTAMRDRLLATVGSDSCAAWAAMDTSQRAVFLTISHRLFTSHTPDGLPVLAHVEGVHAVLGGGPDGDSCGGAENNRLFLSTDAYLHARMVETWDDAGAILDDDGAPWVHTQDAAGPHDPFDASIETDADLHCTLLFEHGDSEPPTAQAHFFVADPVAVSRGEIALPADPHMLEIDQDYNCIHDSNPTCRDFDERYRAHHGDFECEWVPSSCTPIGDGCYRSAASG